MRIRKNANLSSLMFSHASGAEPLQSHVCQLNQSPWDVIPFSHPSSSSLHRQFEDEDSFNGNGSLGDSIGAVESNSFPDREEAKQQPDKMSIDDNSEIEDDQGKDRGEDEMKIECCDKSDPKGWQCRNEKKRGHSMCENQNHLTSMKSSSDNVTRTKKNVAPGGRRGRGRPARKGTTTSNSGANPYEFYYYSGFGPLWGKRRGGGRGRGGGAAAGGEIISKIAEMDGIDEITTSSSDHFDNLDFLEDDDDEDSDENGESVKKKRTRKPVKARSLKSLM